MEWHPGFLLECRTPGDSMARMTADEAKTRMTALASELERHNRLY